MDRREFLKGAVTILPLTEVNDFKPSKPVKPKDFKPDEEYGNIFQIAYVSPKDPIVWDELKRLAYNDMLKVVPAEWRYRVQFRTNLTDYARIASLAWYYPPHGKRPVYCNGKYLCHSTKYLPLPVHSDIGGYGII